ncbi:ZIP family metal transporter [Stackebrandtia nassauensis]|uniref:Zinc/iron permease n=1 Tax=Stackebrandtia nassauensis (strain DSM 44728 / CIP 108903 / NRRL B-16338 / NBRC 102104 / LLR-40K-21) TaxID=446470 RepID=D3PW76_STANL|nr:ZIP family metal transporter [Stackebrandtia nassauensis]ADD41233.1 zinc/iron permease [Stackebrandtia nassauensis DSM 44728]
MAIVLALAAFGSTLLGGLVALRARNAQNLVLGLAAGVMLGVVAFDLMPEALDQAPAELFGVPGPMLTAAGGFLTIHVIERSLAIHRGHEAEFGAHQHGLESVGLLAGSGLVVHSALDGVGIGLAFQVDASVGITVAVAVIAHDFADGFNTFTITTLYGNARKRALLLLFLDAVAPVAGALLASLFTVSPAAIGLYLGYFAGFLLYLATSDILPEAHAKRPSHLTLLCTVAGVAFMWLVVGLSH